MSTDFQRALIQKERELQLVTALDRVRDTLHDDEDRQGMFDAIAAYLKDEFQAEACADRDQPDGVARVEPLVHLQVREAHALAGCQPAPKRAPAARTRFECRPPQERNAYAGGCAKSGQVRFLAERPVRQRNDASRPRMTTHLCERVQRQEEWFGNHVPQPRRQIQFADGDDR